MHSFPTRTLTMGDFGYHPRVPAPAPREPVRVVALDSTWMVGGAPAVPGKRYSIDAAVAGQMVARGKARFA